MFGIGFGELIVIALILFIVVGPQRLPSVMKAAGKGLREFRKAASDLRQSIGVDDIWSDRDHDGH